MSLPPVVFVLVQTGAAADGGVSSIGQIIRGLRTHRPIVVTDRDTARTAEWRSDGIETHVVPHTLAGGIASNPVGAARSYWRYARELRSLIARTGAKVVHCNDPLALQLSILPAKLTGAKLAFNLRDTLDPGRRPPRLRYRFLFEAADHIFYLSKDMADRWAQVAPGAKSAFSVTYSVVDLEHFAPRPPYSGDGPQVVLLSGLVSAKKAQLEFLRQVSPSLAAEGIATWLSGDFDPSRNSYMQACAEAAAPLGEMVRFLGYRADVAELMARSTVVAVPSRHEGLVRAMIEAMSCARPVVSFDVCSAREIIEDQAGGAGTVVTSGDHLGMAEAIRLYCREREFADRAGKKGRAVTLRLFEAETVVSRYERVYDKLECAGD